MNEPHPATPDRFRPRCTEPGCWRPLRRTDRANLAEMLCYEHDQKRVAIRSADQRRRRHDTTAPRVEFPPPEAHWLHDAWVQVSLAENKVRQRTGRDPSVDALLAALTALHDELDPRMDAVAAVLAERPWRKPPKDRHDPAGGRDEA